MWIGDNDVNILLMIRHFRIFYMDNFDILEYFSAG